MKGPHKTIDTLLMVLDKRQAQIDVYTTTTIMQQVTDTSAVSTYMSLSLMQCEIWTVLRGFSWYKIPKISGQIRESGSSFNKRDLHMTKLYVRVIFANACHHFPPQLADFQHIGLVNTA